MVWNRLAVVCVILLVALAGGVGCGGGEKKVSDQDIIPGNWVNYRNRAYILLAMDIKGTWTSSVRVADVTSKIVQSRGTASGTWHLEEGQLILTVMDSDIEDIWAKNDTCFYTVLEIEPHRLLLEDEKGFQGEWKKSTQSKGKGGATEINPVISMDPYAVNLNRLSSNTEDRYLCMNMHLELMELMPDQSVPKFHPRARDAVITYLSSLTYDDVSDYERIKVQKEKLTQLVNPYMEGLVKELVIDHVVIVSTPAQVEAFIIEHTGVTDEAAGEGEEGDQEDGDEQKDAKEES